MSSNLKNILICWLLPKQAPQSLGCCELSLSPLSCLGKSTSNHFDLITIVFNSRDIHCHAPVIELCKTLKTHPLTTETMVSVLVEKPHQKLILKVAQTGVDFVNIHTGIHPDRIEESICRLMHTQSFAPVRMVLEKLCPFLEYIESDGKYDFPVCGAYRNRMVLGGSRLNEICYTLDHSYCEYYLNPKVIS